MTIQVAVSSLLHEKHVASSVTQTETGQYVNNAVNNCNKHIQHSKFNTREMHVAGAHVFEFGHGHNMCAVFELTPGCLWLPLRRGKIGSGFRRTRKCRERREVSLAHHAPHRMTNVIDTRNLGER